MDSVKGLISFCILTCIVQSAIVAYIQVILTGLKAADAEQCAGETEQIYAALVVVLFTCEQALDGICAIQCLRVSLHAAQQSYQLVCVPCGILANEQIGTLCSIVSAVSFVDVCTEHIDSSYAVHRTCFVHLGNDVACCVIVLCNLLSLCAVSADYVNFDLALCGHIRLINRIRCSIGSIRGELAFAVKELLYPVNTHQRHTLDIVNTVEIGAEIDSACVGVAGDGETNDRVSIQICLEVRHGIKILSDIYKASCLAVLCQQSRCTGNHIYVAETLFPILELFAGAVALIFVFELNAELFLNCYPCGLEVASVIGNAVGQCDTGACCLCIEAEAGLCAVVTGRHAKLGSGRIGQSRCGSCLSRSRLCCLLCCAGISGSLCLLASAS